jgi:hypothetical protein
MEGGAILGSRAVGRQERSGEACRPEKQEQSDPDPRASIGPPSRQSHASSIRMRGFSHLRAPPGAV